MPSDRQLALEAAIRNGYVKPEATKFISQLAPDEEASFRRAVKQGLFWPIPDEDVYNSSTADYDYRGYFTGLKNNDPRAASGINGNDGELHYPDVWKTPFHYSFSGESQYASPDAPQWNEEDQLIDPRTHQVVFDERKRK